MTSSNGNISHVTGHLCEEFTGPGGFPTQRPVTRSFDVYLNLHPNKRLSKQWWGWWFETLSRPLWRHCNGMWVIQWCSQVTLTINMLNCFKDYKTYIHILNRILYMAWPKLLILTLEQHICCLSYIVNSMPADALATLGARASTGMALTPKAKIFCLQHQES